MEWFRPARSKKIYLTKPKRYYTSETVQVVDVLNPPPAHHHHHHQNIHIPPPPPPLPPPPPAPIIVEPAQPNLHEDIVVLNNNQHALHQRMERVEENQEYLVAASRRLLHNAHRQDRRLHHIEDDVHHRSRSTGRIAREHITERIAVLPPRRPLLLENDKRHARLDLEDELQRLRIADRVDRAYIGDGVTYVTSRNTGPSHHRRASWGGPTRRRRYAESDTSTISDTSSTDWSRSDFEVELPRAPRPPRHRPIIHQHYQRPCSCGGIGGHHMIDCPRRR